MADVELEYNVLAFTVRRSIFADFVRQLIVSQILQFPDETTTIENQISVAFN